MEHLSSPRARVLVVDGDLRAARMLARMLHEDGFDVEVAADGATAIARLSRSPVPDALVTDLATAYADGLAIARYARSRRAGMPVFFVTDHPDLVHGPGWVLLPPPRIFTKPLDYGAFTRELASSFPEREEHAEPGTS